MSYFEYVSVDSDGKQKKGVLEAESERHARQLLRDQLLIPISIESTQPSKSIDFLSYFKRESTISLVDLSLFTRQLALLLKSGLPLSKALTAISMQHTKKNLRNMVLAIKSKISEGFSLSVSLEQIPFHFSQMYISTVNAGEQSGHLEAILLNLADHLDRQIEFRKNVTSAMIYPVILVILSFSIIALLFVFVIPKIADAFERNGQILPWLTQTLITMSEFFVDYFAMIGIVLGVVLLLIQMLLRKPNYRLLFDRYLLKLPLLKTYYQGLYSAQFANVLSTLITSGISIIDALKITQATQNNSYVRLKLDQTISKVSEGISLHQSLEELGIFSPIMLQMISSGEMSGELEALLKQVAHMQQSEIERWVTMFLKLFEPLMLVLMGGMVMTIVMAILLPIWNLNELM